MPRPPTDSPSCGSNTTTFMGSSSPTIDWPEASPLRGEELTHDESVDIEVLEDSIGTPLSTQSQVGTPSSIPYETPSRRLTPQPTFQESRKDTITPIDTPGIPNHDVAALLHQSWRKAIRVLRANPSLMDSAILCAALRQRPPLYVVDWMLRLNPKAAEIQPSEKGPSPLFVAVQQGCSTAVVETVLRACPKVLVSQPSGSQWDPVALAARMRGQEKDLLSLLRRPVSYWLDKREGSGKESNESRNWPRLGAQKRTTTVIPEVERADLDQVRQRLAMSPKPSPKLGIETMHMPGTTLATPRTKQKQPIPSLLHRTRPLATRTTPELSRTLLSSPNPSVQSSPWTPAERQELDNVKFLCIALLKAHRRMLESGHEYSDSGNTHRATHLDEEERQALLQVMEQKQERQNRICLIALDMKEKAICALAKRMEERLSASNADETQLSAQLRSSYVHLYKRFLGLEEDLQNLKRAALVSSSSFSEADSNQAVFGPPEQRPLEVHARRIATPDELMQDVESNGSEEARGECSRSCLWIPWGRFRSGLSSWGK